MTENPEQLRKLAADLAGAFEWECASVKPRSVTGLLNGSAAEIERLQAENAQLRADIEKALANHSADLTQLR